jgi:outer membrane protein assembly factor BamB
MRERQRRARALAGTVIAIIVLAGLSALAAQSWPQWRGPAGDGRVSDFRPPATWPERFSKAWEATVGSGHASPVLAGSRVVVHTRQGDDEVIAAYDLQTGKALWQDRYEAPYTMNPAARGHGPGPKSTPAIADGRVFTLGISGILSALDLTTGAVRWRTSAAGVLPLYGTATSPVVDGSHVVVFMGGHDRGAFTAFEAATGDVRWRWEGDGPGYATPIVATLAGMRQFVTQSQSRVVGIEAATGRLLWEIPFTTNFDQNSVTPLLVDGLVVYSGLENGTTAVRVVRKGAGFATEQVWHNEQVSMYMSSPVIVSGRIIGLSHRNRGQFFALDAATGATLWVTRGREADNASLLVAGPWLLVGTTNAELIVARPDAGGLGEVRRYQVADSAVWAHPVLAGQRLLVKDVDTLGAWTIPGR